MEQNEPFFHFVHSTSKMMILLLFISNIFLILGLRKSNNMGVRTRFSYFPLNFLRLKITRKNKKQKLPMTNFKVNHPAIDKLIRILAYTMKYNYHFLIFILIKSIYHALPNLSFFTLSYMNCIPLLWKRWQGGDKFCLPCPISSRLIPPHLECVFIYLLFNIYIFKWFNFFYIFYYHLKTLLFLSLLALSLLPFSISLLFGPY